MRGLMMDSQLLTTELLKHAARNYRHIEIVTRTVEGPIHRYTIGEAKRRIEKLADALVNMGVQPGDRVGVIGWNTYRQFEMYYAVGGIGAVLHTVNPRLGPENAGYVINHAEDKFLFFDNTFAPLVAALKPHVPCVKRFVAMTSREHAPAFPGELDIYDEIVERGRENFDWPEFDENTAVAMCYTSGATGEPKGVVYSHRSVVIQSFAACLPTAMGLGEGDVLLPVVPMFHVNAWNAPYSAMLVGAKQVFPGPRLDGEGLYEMFEAEKVTFSSGVPTVWLNLLHYLEKTGKKLNYLKRGMCGGSALPEALIRGYAKYGVELQQGWGMTEMSPIGTVNVLPPNLRELPADERIKHQVKQGRALPFVDMRIVSPEGKVLPHDGEQDGHLQVRGPCIIKDYYKREGKTLTTDGWFDTGDVALIDEDGFLQITDRSKDVIKTGGEWVSSIDIENAALLHPAVAQAGVIGVTHPKWQERPLLVVVKKEGAETSSEEVREFLKDKLDKIAWPDAVEFIQEMPLGATGKVLKTELRKMFGSYQLPE